MPNRLPIPDDLQHLIEKRSGSDRRGKGARPAPTTGKDVAGNAPLPTVAAPKQLVQGDRRKADRRRSNS